LQTNTFTLKGDQNVLVIKCPFPRHVYEKMRDEIYTSFIWQKRQQTQK